MKYRLETKAIKQKVLDSYSRCYCCTRSGV